MGHDRKHADAAGGRRPRRGERASEAGPRCLFGAVRRVRGESPPALASLPLTPPRTRRVRFGHAVRAGGGGCAAWLGVRAPATHASGPMRALKKRKTFVQHTELTKKPVDGFSAGLVEDSLFEWAITVMGPPDTY